MGGGGPPAGYATRWYNGTATGAPDQGGATPLAVAAAGQALPGTNASLVPLGSIAGQVTDAVSGLPVAGTCVYLYPLGDSASASYGTCTLSDGTYEMYGVAAGSYDIAFADTAAHYATQWYNGSPGGAPAQGRAAPVVVSSSAPTVTSIDAAMSLVDFGGVSGTVVVAGSAPLSAVAGAVVYLYSSTTAGSASYATSTAPDGTYEVYGVPPGTYYVAFADPSAGNATQWYDGSPTGAASQASANPVTVLDGASITTDIDAEMSPAVGTDNVEGAVTDAITHD